MLADASPAALLARGPYPTVLADAGPATHLACGPDPAVLVDAGPTALLAPGALPVVLALQSGPIVDTDPPLGIEVLSAFSQNRFSYSFQMRNASMLAYHISFKCTPSRAQLCVEHSLEKVT